METLYALLAVIAGMVLRLVIPILITILAIYGLRKLDARWQVEAQTHPLPVKKPECWKINNCPPAKRKTCPGYITSLPCWQARRLVNGYLREECLTCAIFRKAPVPVHAG